MKRLTAEGFVCGNATAYKTRSPRENDPNYIRCVESIEQIPVQQDDLICSNYGDDKIFYDKQGIESAISRGEIVFMATGIPDLASQIKGLFKGNCLSIFIKRQQVDKETMIREEAKRHGFTKEEIAKAEQTVNARIAVYESLKPKYVEYVQHEETGADYIMSNYFTLFGGDWNTSIDNQAKSEIYSAVYEIKQVYDRIQANPEQDWRSDRTLVSSNEDRENPLTLLDIYSEYLRRKREWTFD